MAVRLFLNDAPIINDFLNDPLLSKNLQLDGNVDCRETFHLYDYYLSDSGLSLGAFDRKDLRVAQVHQIFRSKGRQAIKDGDEILKLFLKENPSCDLIFGLTPVHLKAARWLNGKLNFKMVKYEFLNNDTFAIRYELSRNEGLK